MSIPFMDLPLPAPQTVRTPMRPSLFTSATSQPRPRQPLGSIGNSHYTLAPICANSPWHPAPPPVTPGGPVTTIPYTPSPTYNIARNTSSFSRTDSCFSVGSIMATPLSDDGSDDLAVSPELEVRLAGLKPPARYPGPLPDSFTRQDPVPGDDDDEEDEKKAKGAPSQNPWDYMRKLKKKERRRFTKRELEAIETLWWVEKAPNKYQRQRIGAWLGVPTKHITVWFQNKRQESKKHAKEKQEAEAQKSDEVKSGLLAPIDKENIPPTPVRSKDTLPTPSSRTGRGSYDPGTGKWRPVPASLISSANPPTQAKCDAILAIANGELTRDEFSSPAPPPHTLALPRLPSRPVLGRNLSGSLDDIMSAREKDRPRAPKRYFSERLLSGDDQERNRELLECMSNPASSSPSGDTAGSPRPGSDRRGSGGSPLPKRPCPNPISTRPRDSFDRVQTEEVLNGPPTSSPPSLSPPTPVYLIRSDNYTPMLFESTTVDGRRAPPSNRHPALDQGDEVFSVGGSEVPRQPQQEGRSEAMFQDQDDEMVQAAALLCALGAGPGPAGQR